MAQYSRPRQPRYSTAKRRRPPSRSRRPRPGTTRPSRRKRSPAPILIIAAVIIALIFCWVFGRGCGGNKEAKENEALRQYTTEANKLIQRSAAIGTKFDNLRNGIADLTRDEVSTKMSQMESDCKEVAEDAGKVEVPTRAEDIHPLMVLSFNLRTGGVADFKTSILEVLDDKSTDDTPTTMSQGLMDLLVSDESLERFRSSLENKLKKANLSFEKVADSRYVPNVEDAMSANVREYIDALTGTSTGDEIHGVAVVGLSTSPARDDSTSSGVSILPYSDTFTVKVAVENQGNQTEREIPVVVTLTVDPEGTPQKKTQKITRLNAGETATLVFEGLTPATGTDKVNDVEVTAGPVKNEKKTDNNTMELEFVMRAEGD